MINNKNKKMNENLYLKRLFHTYYKEKASTLPQVSFIDKREFASIPWEHFYMERHTGLNDKNILTQYLIDRSPKHFYYSGSVYLQPDNKNMENKGYQGCDFIIDIDVDHFFTPCKNRHDYWRCKNCDTSGKGMITKCPKCKSKKLKTLSWICESCLNKAKEEILKIIYDFLIPNFNISDKDMNIAFSGHRGYHLKIENEKMRGLSGEDRREIANYLTGENISLDILGIQEKEGVIYGLSKESIGWPSKIITKIEEFLLKPIPEIEAFLLDKNYVGFGPNLVKAFINSKDDFYEILTRQDHNIWFINDFGKARWFKFLNGMIADIGAEIDIPVTVDIHRLIRYPGSLHGKTGFKVQELTLNKLKNFNPLDEKNEKLDPIVFEGKKDLTHKLKIIENTIPMTKIKGEQYGPYKNGEIIEVPHHIAVFLLCKGVAKTI